MHQMRFKTYDRTRRASVDLRLRPRGHFGQVADSLTAPLYRLCVRKYVDSANGFGVIDVNLS
jgi:hypothetical protein